MNSPIILRAPAVSLAPNAVLELDPVGLENPFRTPMLVDEIRFYAEAGSGALQLIPRVEIKLGREPITHGYMPIRLLAKVMNGSMASGNTFLAFSVWKLDKPLYVPPNQRLSIRVASVVTSSDASATVLVSCQLAGRSLSSKEPIPKSIWLPYGAFWTTPVVSNGAIFENQSAESDLVNPFDMPIQVQRFVGYHSAERTIKYQLATQLTTVQAVDSFGNILVRDKTPFSHLFCILDRTWTVRATLQPKGFYIFNTIQDYTLAGPVLGNQCGIGMVGYREVPLT